MKYLLDTHTLIWLFTNEEKLSDKVKIILENPKNEIYVSAISFWEISLKNSIGKLELHGGDTTILLKQSEINGFKVIPLTAEVCSSFDKLTVFYHRDPFDRMLIWQAISEGFILISKDAIISLYKSEGLKTIW